MQQQFEGAHPPGIPGHSAPLDEIKSAASGSDYLEDRCTIYLQKSVSGLKAACRRCSSRNSLVLHPSTVRHVFARVRGDSVCMQCMWHQFARCRPMCRCLRRRRQHQHHHHHHRLPLRLPPRLLLQGLPCRHRHHSQILQCSYPRHRFQALQCTWSRR